MLCDEVILSVFIQSFHAHMDEEEQKLPIDFPVEAISRILYDCVN